MCAFQYLLCSPCSWGTSSSSGQVRIASAPAGPPREEEPPTIFLKIFESVQNKVYEKRNRDIVDRVY